MATTISFMTMHLSRSSILNRSRLFHDVACIGKVGLRAPVHPKPRGSRIFSTRPGSQDATTGGRTIKLSYALGTPCSPFAVHILVF